jgi:serine protease Do
MNVQMNLRKAAGAATGLALALAGAIALGPALTAQGTRAPLDELHSALAGAPSIGATIRDLTESEAGPDNAAGRAGAYVEEVRQGGPAAAAGFQAGDIVLSFDGERVRGARQLERLVGETPGGREVEVVVLRAGSRMTLEVAPEGAPGALLRGRRFDPSLNIRPFTAPSEVLPVLPFGSPHLGVNVQEMTGQLGEYFGAADGVLVTSVASGSPAEAAGLKAGDVITKVGDVMVGSAGDLRRRLSEASGDVTVTIVRDRKEQTLSVQLGGTRGTTGPRRMI